MVRSVLAKVSQTSKKIAPLIAVIPMVFDIGCLYAIRITCGINNETQLTIPATLMTLATNKVASNNDTQRIVLTETPKVEASSPKDSN